MLGRMWFNCILYVRQEVDSATYTFYRIPTWLPGAPLRISIFGSFGHRAVLASCLCNTPSSVSIFQEQYQPTRELLHEACTASQVYRECTGSVQGEYRECYRESTGSIQGVYRACIGRVQGVYWKSTGSVQGVYRESTGRVQGVYRECTGRAQEEYRECTGSVQGVYWKSTGSVQGVYRESTGRVQGVYRECTGSVLEEYRECTGGAYKQLGSPLTFRRLTTTGFPY